MHSKLTKAIDDFANKALRTISFGYKDLNKGDGGPAFLDVDESKVIHVIEKTGFTLVAIVGIKDILRPEVFGAIKQCHEA